MDEVGILRKQRREAYAVVNIPGRFKLLQDCLRFLALESLLGVNGSFICGHDDPPGEVPPNPISSRHRSAKEYLRGKHLNVRG